MKEELEVRARRGDEKTTKTEREGKTHLHRCGPPGAGGPHAILRSRQNKHAMIGFFFSGSRSPCSPSRCGIVSLNIACPAVGPSSDGGGGGGGTCCEADGGNWGKG